MNKSNNPLPDWRTLFQVGFIVACVYLAAQAILHLAASLAPIPHP